MTITCISTFTHKTKQQLLYPFIIVNILQCNKAWGYAEVGLVKITQHLKVDTNCDFYERTKN